MVLEVVSVSDGGIGRDELAWIERDQFVYYATLAFMLGDPSDWPAFRQDMLGALVAARLQPRWLAVSRVGVVGTKGEASPSQEATLQLLDDARRRVDPASDWEAFLQTLWTRVGGA